jgi:hypothetical protein
VSDRALLVEASRRRPRQGGPGDNTEYTTDRAAGQRNCASRRLDNGSGFHRDAACINRHSIGARRNAGRKHNFAGSEHYVASGGRLDTSCAAGRNDGTTGAGRTCAIG